MSDHNRGAYTPHHDAPLSFDARQSQGRRAFPTTLVVSLLILIGLGVAIFMFYRSGVRGANEPPTPVGTPVGEIKTPAPAQSQAPADSTQGLQIYKSESGGAAPEAPTTFAPPPEQPRPRPAPTAPVASKPITSAAEVAASGATAKAQPMPPPAIAPAPAPVTRPAAHAPPGDEIGALLKPKPAAAKPVLAASAAAPHSGTLVQIGAYSSAALASQQWSELAAAYGGDMHGKGKVIEPVERNGKTLFRAAASGFATHEAAVAFCGKLKAAGKACIVR